MELALHLPDTHLYTNVNQCTAAESSALHKHTA